MTQSSADRRRYETPVWLTVEWETMRTTLRQRRIDLGMTQAEVSEAMGRSKDFVAVLENNVRTIPNVATLMIWVAALGGSVLPRFGDRQGVDT